MPRQENSRSKAESNREWLITEVKKYRGGFRYAFEVEGHLFADRYLREYQPPQCIQPRNGFKSGDITVLPSGRAYIFRHGQLYYLDPNKYEKLKVVPKPYTYSVKHNGTYYTFTQEELVEVESEPSEVKAQAKTAARTASGSGAVIPTFAGAAMLAGVITIANMGGGSGTSEPLTYGENNGFPQDSGLTRSKNLSLEQGARVLINGETYVAVRVPDYNFSGYAFRGEVQIAVDDYIGLYRVVSVAHNIENNITICQVVEDLRGAGEKQDNEGW